KAAQTGVDIDFQVGVIESIPFPDNTFDVVLSSLMMHHLPDALKWRGLVEIRRVLKPQGRLLIVDFKRPTSHFSHWSTMLMLHGQMKIGVQDLTVKLQEVGFSNIRAGNTNFRSIGYVSAQAGK